MAFSTWIQAEQFYNRTVMWIALGSIVIIFIGLFIVFYAERKKAVRFIGVLTIVLVLVGVWTFEQHQQYALYLKEYSLTSPLIRDRQADAIVPVFYSEREKKVYARLNDLESLQELSLYEEKDHSIPIHYLGESQFLHYFEYEGKIFHTSSRILYTDDVSDAQIVGSEFTLKDPRYMEIGFNNDLNTMFRAIEVNEKNRQKSYTPEAGQYIPSIKEVFHQWNF
ncbi:hypothetical protein LMF32_00340 [Desemzia sp. C1]|uniref:hypothetical protein n=1 Tax=Desemzia sp. C1 TaxID=2892016 RepID=UPI001E32AB71|nr:hypothetical protein [Desemzia sp. C1]MCI3027582.1 hypothetical protein [Desemzia sp. C1]